MDFETRLQGFRPAPWEALPDLGLYMDQVITYINRQYQPLYGGAGDVLTPAMVNNYVKARLVDRPVGKKYDRCQLAQLMMICVLKQTTSMEDMRALLTPAEGMDMEGLYRAFCELHARSLADMAAALTQATPMSCAVRAAAYRLLCEEVLASAKAEKTE